MATVDLSEFHRLALASTSRHKPCAVAQARAVVGKDEVGALDAALAADIGVIPTGSIRQWLARRKLVVSISALTSHRNGTCRCAKEAS